MYRDLAEPGPRCARHPAASSKATCTRCGAQVCEPCGLYDGLSVICPVCQRARRGAGRLGAWAALVAVGLGLGMGAQRVYDPYHWGPHRSAIRNGMTALERNGCDTPTIDALVRELAAAGDARGVGAIFDATLGNCSLPADLHELAYSFHFWRGQYEAAVADASRLIRLRQDASSYYKRANAYLSLGRHAESFDDEQRGNEKLRGSALVGL